MFVSAELPGRGTQGGFSAGAVLEMREETLMNDAAVFPDLMNDTGRIVPEGSQTSLNAR